MTNVEIQKPKKKKISPAYIYFFGAFGGLLFGYDIGVMTGALPFLQESWNITSSNTLGWITSILMLGAAFGGMTAGKLCDKLGRRKIILLAAAVFVLGAILCAVAPDYMIAWLLVSRFLLGLGVGSASALVPPYISEMAPADKRGKLSGINQLMIVSGMLISYIVDYIFSTCGISGDLAWRCMVGAAAIPGIILFLGVLRLPESPRFLVKTGKLDQARQVLSYLRPPDEIEKEIQGIEQTLANRHKHQVNITIKHCFSKRYRYLVIAGIGIASFQQFMGANSIFYYIPLIVQDVTGTAATDALQWPIVNGILLVAGAVLYMIIAERFKRRSLLILGGSVMAFAFFMPAILTLILGDSFPQVITLGFLFLFVMFYSFTWAPLTWTVVGEVFPLEIRGQASGYASFMNWVGSFIVGLFFPIMAAQMASSSVFAIFGVICVAAVFFVIFRVPETKGKTLEQIEAEANNRGK